MYRILKTLLLPLLGLPLATSVPQLGLIEDLFGNNPQISLDYATFKGTNAFLGVGSFLGMPFAKAGRYENPRVVNAQQDKLEGVQDATKYGIACPQQELIASPLDNGNAELGSLLSAVEQAAFGPLDLLQQGEECLSINVQVPSGVNSTEGLPVMVSIS